MERWNFLTKHARALLCIARDPDVRLRDIALSLGITERRAYAIVADLTTAGYLRAACPSGPAHSRGGGSAGAVQTWQ